MTALELIAELRERGIRIAAVEGELELDAPAGSLTPELREQLIKRKAELLRLLSWSRRSGRSVEEKLQPVGRNQPLPLSWAQQRLWFLDQLEPGSSAYNISWTVRLRGELHAVALQAAVDQLVMRHETLRTRFPNTAGVPHQHIDPEQTITIQLESLAGASDEKLRATLARLASLPFDLVTGPMLRMHLLQLSHDEHILLVVIHHIVADGASMRVLFRELAALYDAELEGQRAELPPLAVQYADFSVWQRNWLDGEELDRQVSYWTERLADMPPLLELPWDRPRAAAMRYRGASVLRVLPAGLADELRALGRTQGCTLFMVMLAAFYVLLMRYSGREDLVVGTPMGGRPRTDLEGLIGFFINTVVLRADLAGDPSFAQLLETVREVALEAHANQELPFEKLVEVLQPERELSYSPVFQVMFDLQEEPRWRLPVKNLEVIPEVVFSSRTSSFDLTLSVRQAESGLDAMFEYDTDLFDEITIERMAYYYQTLLEEIVLNPDKPVSALSLLHETAGNSLVQTWGTLAAPYPDASGLAALFEQQVARQSDATALIGAHGSCSYAELNRRANRLAYRLQSLGVAQGATVAICAGRSLQNLAAQLAVLKVGACVVPLDPAYPATRLQGMLRQSSAMFLLLDEEVGGDVWSGLDKCAVVRLTEDVFVSPDYSGVNPDVPVSPDDLAFLLFTSGSTGEPKAVELPHRGLINYIHQLGLKTELSAADRVLQFAALGFDIAIEESFVALLHGACLVLREEGMNESAEAFWSGCAKHEVSWISLPTAWWHELCAGLHRLESGVPKTLKNLVIGGEKADSAAFARWHKYVGDAVRLFNTYGPTETSIVATWCELTHREPGQSELPIGHPVPNVRVWVLDEHQQLLPPGVPGELYIGGAGVAHGYRNRPDETAARFIADPFSAEPNASLYRTGDRARYLPDGRLVFMGRIDDQVKLRGHRIEPGEIEAVLNGLDIVDRCAVLVRDARLVAYVVGQFEVAELRKHLQSVLPDYMVPTVFVQLEELPLTPNGKLDRKALPAPVLMRDESAEFVGPRNKIEQQLASIWSEVLGVQRVGIHDDFFALGGHSLLATRVVARIGDVLDRSLALRALFNEPTVAGLAALLLASPETEGVQPITPRRNKDDLPPLSWAQQRLWFLDQLEGESEAYHLPWSARISGSINVSALQAAINHLLQRHESLRTTFAVRDGEPVQLIANQLQLTINLIEAGPLTDTEIDKQLVELLRQPFDLQAGPLLRVHVLKLSEDDAVLLLVMHHIVSDGWSMGVLFKELAALYDAEVQGHPAELPELPVQYADYAVWQRAWLSGDELERQVSYWSAQLDTAPPLLELPLDHPRPPVQRYRGAWVNQTFSPELLEGLRRLARREGCTLFMVLLAAFKVLLARHTGVEDLVVGTPIAGRKRTELEGLIGFFLNTLALRTDLSGNPGFSELLGRVRTTTLDAYEHQELPFEKLLEVLQPVRSTAHTPVVQVMFNLHNEPGSGLSLAGLAVNPFSIDRGTAKFDLAVALVEGASGLQAGFEYNTDLFDRETIDLLMRQFACLLERVVVEPDANIAEIEIENPYAGPIPDKHAIPNAAFSAKDLPLSIAARFSRAAEFYKDNCAVQTPVESLTYAELDARANAVGWQLAGRAGERIGLLLGQDGTMLAGLLGVLKAGCAYVPLDPAAPPARLKAIIRDAGIRTLISDAAYADLLSSDAVEIMTVPVTGRDDAPAVDIRPDDLAYVLFTSGSTGQPKGVMQTHRNVLHHVQTYADALQITAQDRLTLLSGYGFDAAVMDIFGALLNGACLYPFNLRELINVSEHLRAAKITLFHATPTVFRYLFAEIRPLDVSDSIRAVVLGGEEATAEDFALYRKQFAPPTLFVNGLGPSESTLALQFFADHGTRLPGNAVPVGTPVADTEVLLLNADGTPAGICGELAIRSAYVSSGYWNQPELTRERFIPDPESPEKTLYRTGDRARYLPDGRLVFMGRIDDQVKVRGHRIEPGEIEAAVLALDGGERCARCVVVLYEGRLVAYVVGQFEVAELRKHLQAALPDYMVPAAFVQLDELPLTPNGKLDRKALPAPVLMRDESAEFVAPRTDIEIQLAQIWADVLGVEKVGIHDDFFALGGHSLLATRVVARVRDVLGYTLSLRVLFGQATIAELSVLLEATPRSDEQFPLVPRADDGGLPPLSWAQQRLWFLDQLEPESSAYNLHWSAKLNGHLKPDCLQTAVAALIARHESLRTRFVSHAGEPMQVIMPQMNVPVRVETLPGISDERLHSHLRELLRQPFDLQAGPLLRVHVLKLSEDDAVLLLVMHHIVSDGWSMGVLFKELAALYDAEVQGHPAELPELPVQYADYAVWQRAWLSGDELERQVSYWSAQLDTAPPLLELPLDHPRPPVQRYRGAWVNQTFSPELLEGLRRLARREGCTLFMVLLAAFKVLLARHTGVEDLVVGTPIAGRKRTELEGLIGFFLNTLALRTDLSGNPGFSELLGRVRTTTLDAYEHQELPFEKLLEVLQPVRSTAHTPVVQVMFNLHNEPGSGLSLAGLAVNPFSIDRGTAKFDLAVALVEGASGLQAGFEYNTDLFDRETIDLLMRHYGELLWAVTRDSASAIGGIRLTSAAKTPAPYPVAKRAIQTGLTLTDQFRLMVAGFGHRPAVKTVNESLTYAELDARANAVGWQLAGRAGERIGLLLGQDGTMLAGLLGVLKAGCAYVPLDPAAPPARLKAIIRDAGIRTLISDAAYADLLSSDAAEIMTVPVTGRDDAPAVDIRPDDLAYVLFTSGSTGQPKGVMQTHRNVLHHVQTYADALQITAQDRLTLLSGYGFDAAVMDIFGALLNGACLYPLQLKDEEYPGELLDRMGEVRISVLHATPTVFRHLMRNKVCRHDLTCIRFVVLGGEEALANDFALYRKQFAPPTLFVNGLGPSESTLALQFFADHGTRLPGNAVPVGTPVADTEVLLLNADGTPAGICGELAIRSAYVSSGYWNQPELTRERFIPDPESPEKTLYRTGDRARYLPDGRLVFMGRIDDQVKVRGHRIEPGEIEAAVLALDGGERCARCVVVLYEGRLVAYVVGQFEVAELRKHLQAALPDYMVPAAFVQLDELPLTPNGKLDRKALPAPVLMRDESAEFVAPRTDIEIQLAQIWADVLGVEKVGIHDDFFALGGHSLMAAQLVARVTDSMKVGLPIRRLFDKPTIAGLAEHVENLRWALGQQ